MLNLKINLRLVKEQNTFSWNRAEKHLHNFGKAIGKGLGLLKNRSQLIHCKILVRKDVVFL